jgi:dTMP kinase
MRRGLFVTFEGSEGCGKSTQIRRLAAWLRETGHPCLTTREPGGTAAGDRMRDLLQHAPEGHGLVPEAELFLFAASRAQHVREVIRPALARGEVVISDRFHDSTEVYQGVARQLDPAMTRTVNGYAIGETLPDITWTRVKPLRDCNAASGRPIGWKANRSTFTKQSVAATCAPRQQNRRASP